MGKGKSEMTLEEINKVKDLFLKGLSISEIGRIVHRHPSSVSYHIKRGGDIMVELLKQRRERREHHINNTYKKVEMSPENKLIRKKLIYQYFSKEHLSVEEIAEIFYLSPKKIREIIEEMKNYKKT